MTETYYRKLNLPANPLIKGLDPTNLPVPEPGAARPDPAMLNILNQETLDAFKSVGLAPSIIFVLGNKMYTDADPAFDRRSAPHCDLYWINGNWQREIFAINYHLTPDLHSVIWKFWDIKAQPVMPDRPTDDQQIWLAGLHYHVRQSGGKLNLGNPEDYTMIDQFVLDCPTLCRVETAHSVHHTNAQSQRYGLSIRFSHNFSSWHQVERSLASLFCET